MAEAMTDAPEFSYPVRIDLLGEVPRNFTLAADEAERTALARRFGLVSIERIESNVDCVRNGDRINASGRLRAAVTQSCVATGDRLETVVDEPFEIQFAPAEVIDANLDEVELSEHDCDVVAYAGGSIDLGEAAAETLYLALDPFPRGPDADTALKEAGVVGEDDARPFSALSNLRDTLRDAQKKS